MNTYSQLIKQIYRKNVKTQSTFWLLFSTFELLFNQRILIANQLNYIEIKKKWKNKINKYVQKY